MTLDLDIFYERFVDATWVGRHLFLYSEKQYMYRVLRQQLVNSVLALPPDTRLTREHHLQMFRYRAKKKKELDGFELDLQHLEDLFNEES